MPAVSKEFKQGIQNIPVKELQKLVLKIARSSKEVYDLINVEYLLKEEAEQDLFEETKAKIQFHLFKLSSKGPLQKSIATSIGKAVKEINYYTKVTGNKRNEAELLNLLLNEVFTDFSDDLGTCWTVFDSKLGITTKRLLNLVTKKLHEDYLLDFKDDLNKYLKILHSRSNHIDLIYNLPDNI